VKKLLISVVGLLVSFALAASANALSYQFSGDAYGGIASATMEVTITGNQVTIAIDNTSPRKTNDALSYNSPAINGFGFNLGSLVKPSEWVLSARKTSAGDISTISGSATGTKGLWDYGTNPAASLNFMFTTGYYIQGYLLNPVAGPSGLGGPFYTTAILTMTFNQNVEGFTDPLISFTNVGTGGKGELTLTPTPEPGTLLLMGIGLIGIALVMREML